VVLQVPKDSQVDSQVLVASLVVLQVALLQQVALQ
jgi:hypothetical protein